MGAMFSELGNADRAGLAHLHDEVAPHLIPRPAAATAVFKDGDDTVKHWKSIQYFVREHIRSATTGYEIRRKRLAVAP